MSYISESVKCVCAKDNYIYVITNKKIKKYDSEGLFIEEFEIELNTEDCIIL